jgi:hypothetical protein
VQRPVPVLALTVVFVCAFFAGGAAVLLALVLIPVVCVAKVVAWQRSHQV